MFFKTYAVAIMAVTVAGNPDLDLNFTNSDAIDYLEKFGYLSEITGFSVGDPFRESVSKFQEEAGLQVTGELDDDTKELMVAPRCGLQFAEARQGALRWEKKTLTYRVDRYSRHISRVEVDRTIRQAMDFWEAAADIKFVKTRGKADIEIKFQGGEHGDGISFDGPGGVLAHAFYPSRSPIGGDAHFDDDEKWSVTNYVGKQLLQTATHELGHSLGLDHSKVYGSVMYFSYPGWDPNMKLHRNDVVRIQDLYGKPKVRPKTVDNDPNCECDELTVTDKKTGQTMGNCKSVYQGRSWCYIKSGSDCSDAKKSSKLNKDWSWKACEGRSPSTKGGNERDCECNGVKRYNAKSDLTVGQCLTKHLGKLWCYVSSHSNCKDKKGTRRNKDGMRYYSSQPCQSETRSRKQTSNSFVFPE